MSERVIYDATPARRPLPRQSLRYLIGPAILLGLVVACTLGLWIARDTFDPQARAERAEARYRQSLQAQRLSWADDTLYIGIRVLPLLLLAAAGAVGVLALYRRIAARETTLLHYEVAALQARHQPGQLPHSLTYSPHLASRSDAPALPPAVLPDTTTEALPGPIDFAQLLGSFTPSKDQILLGLGPGNERITVSIGQLCHVALCGATGGGKSNLHRLLIPQLQSIGAKVVLGDPHFTPYDIEHDEDWRPIMRRLYRPPAVRAEEIDELLDWLNEELRVRLELRQQSKRWGPPLFLAFDELPVISSTVKHATERLGTILREGRKVHMFAIGAAQDFLVKTIGGSSAIRDAYRTAFYVGGDRISASALLDLPQREIDDGPLGAGVVLLRSAATRPAQQVRVPLASNQALYQLLTPKTLDTTAESPASALRSDTTHQGSASEQEISATHRFITPPFNTPKASADKTGKSTNDRPESAYPESTTANESHDRERYYGVKYLRLVGKSKTAILKELWGVTGGKPYQTASAEYEAIVRQLEQEEGTKQ